MDAAAQRRSIGPFYRCLAGRVNLHQDEPIHLRKNLHKGVIEFPGAAEAMRLISHQETALRPDLPGGAQHCADFGGMMPVVVHQGHLGGAHANAVIYLETAANPGELRKPLLNGLVVDALVGGGGDGRQGVLHIVAARRRQADGQGGAPLRAGSPKAPATAFNLDLRDREVGVLGEAVGQHGPRYPGQQAAQHRIVQAQHGGAVERQPVDKFDEGVLQALEVMAVGGHVVRVDVGDDRQHGLQAQKGGVRLIGLHDDRLAHAQTGVGTGAFQQAADHEGGVQSRGLVNGGQQACGGGLAVGAGDGDAVPIAHEFAEHLRPGNHRNALFARPGELWIAVVNGAGPNHHIGARHLFGGVAVKQLGAQGGQPRRHRRRMNVRPGHLVSLVDEHFGNAGHAGPADADEVNASDAAHLRHPEAVPAVAAVHGRAASNCARQTRPMRAEQTMRLLPP